MLLVIAACGASSDAGGQAASSAGLPGASPATSPALTAKPAGTVVSVGALPQGIVYDPATGLLAVAVHDPYRLLLLDSTTLATQVSVALPGKARHVKLAAPGGPILVPDETSDRLFEIDLPGGEATSVEVLSHPHDAVLTASGDIIVGDEFSEAYSVVRDGRMVDSVKDLERPGGLNTYGNLLSAVDVEGFTLSTYDLTTLERTGRIPAGEGPTHAVLTTGHREVVVDTRAGKLRLFSLEPLKELGSIDVGGTPYGIDTDLETGIVWTTLTATNQVIGVDFTGPVPRKVAAYDTVRQPDTVAVAPGGHTLWVTGTRGDQIQRITR